MTTVEVLYRYAAHPGEAAMLALGNTCEVYGIRSIHLDAEAKTVRVEYDATRLSRAIVAQLLRRGGISITGEVSLIPAPPEPVAAAPTAPVQPSVTSAPPSPPAAQAK